jgi:YgiT-type zinc finger domain-containing protein
MTCFFCKGNLKESTTAHVVESGERVLIIKNVPCLKCEQCVEISYTGDVYERLEYMVDALKNSEPEVAIVRYADKAA